MPEYLVLSILIVALSGQGLARTIRPPAPAATTPPLALENVTDMNRDKRQNIQTELSTCGYLNGDPTIPRIAKSGYNCRVDTLNGLWGFCPTTNSTTPTPQLPSSTAARETSQQLNAQPPLSVPSTRSSSQSSPSRTRTALPAATSTNTAAGSRPSTDSKNGVASNNNAPIIAGVLGGVALLSVAGLAAIYLLRRHRSGRSCRGRFLPVLAQTHENDESGDNKGCISSKHAAGGWGPSELQGCQRQSPVELPS
ncbi:hypothetical protein E4U55_005036 [Claviceps digitariae]|nr:hypothetical protein E4U55_005036 [Claviceps digitariae]